MPEHEQRSFFAYGMWIVVAIALAKLLFHCYYNNRYGYFRDEFDYMACGDHLAWGYVDQPPLIPFLIHSAGPFWETRCEAFVLSRRWRLLFWWCRLPSSRANLADGDMRFCSAQ